MTQPLDWFAAPFEAYGGTSGDGARRLLGQPSLDPLTVLVRETIQNSWDARDVAASVPLEYRIHLRTLDASERRVLDDIVFAEGVDHGELGLKQALARESLPVIEISDSGTTGLAGPVRADLTPSPGEPTDFVDFIFNIGAVRDTELGGGTYGFGKTIAYVVSRASTMLVASCVDEGGELQRRFIASAIGSQFPLEGRRYTGRQWWGHCEDDRIEPITGSPAVSLADSLGLDANRPGTSLLVLDPDLRGRSHEEAMRFLVSSVLWHAWPKMIPPPSSTSRPMRISARLEGEDYPVPEPTEFAALRPFVSSLQQVRAVQAGLEAPKRPTLPSDVSLIECLRPKQRLGHLGLAFDSKFGYSAYYRTESQDGNEDSPQTDACPFEGHSHHTALLRQAELVVAYEAGPPAAVPGFRWGGVFRTLEEVDDHFAMAEPPAHNEWDPEFVNDRHGRSFVRVALRRIKDSVAQFCQPTTGESASSSSVSAARIGDLLAGLIPSIDGARPGPGSRTSRRRGSTGARNNDLLDVEISGTELVRGTSGPEVHLTVDLESDTRPTCLQAEVAIRNDTGREASAPAGARPPILGPLISEGDQRVQPDNKSQFLIPANAGTRWTLVVAVPDIAALDIDLSARIVRAETT